jgi:hypothetical protein
MSMLLRQLLAALLWGAGFLFSSVFLQCVVFRDYFRVPSPTGEVIFQWNASWKYVHMAVGAIGLVMGILGCLPGTRSSKQNE